MLDVKLVNSISGNSTNPLNYTISSGHTTLTTYVKSNPKFHTSPNLSENLCLFFGRIKLCWLSLCDFDSEARSTRRKKVGIKEEDEVVEEEQQSSEEEYDVPVPDLINDTDDPDCEPELENEDDDDNEIDELRRDMKQEQVSYFLLSKSLLSIFNIRFFENL